MAELDPTVSEKIKQLLAKDPNEYTDFDKNFLRARRGYIGPASRKRLAFVFDETEEEQKAAEQRTEAAKKAKEQAEAKSQEDQNAHLQPVDEAEEDEEEIDDEEDEEQAVG